MLKEKKSSPYKYCFLLSTTDNHFLKIQNLQ